MTIVDKDGVPCMVQFWRFYGSWQGYEVTLFNGQIIQLCSSTVQRTLPGFKRWTDELTFMALEQVCQRIYLMYFPTASVSVRSESDTERPEPSDRARRLRLGGRENGELVTKIADQE